MYGYMGKLLFINLTTGEKKIEPLDEKLARDFLGGPGLGARVLYERMPAHTDVFGDESMIGFVSGPLNNTKALFGGRYTVVSKSPVTGGWNDANSGGFFGERLKKCGYDAIFVNGISNKPVYILVDNGEVEILDASELWGLTTRATEDKLMARYGKKVGIALIGPAGENLSYMAAVMNDGHRAAARGGSGAVMGSKMLKAVVVKGHCQTPIADPKMLSKINWEIRRFEGKAILLNKESRDFFFYGTGGTYVESVTMSDTGFKNWTATNLLYTEEDAKKQSSQGLKKYKTKKYHCSRCDVGCSVFMKIDTRQWGTIETTRPEYETMGAFGSLLLNKNVESVCMANHLCNELGFDTISAGSTIAWAMECYERGVFSKEELNGIELCWGDKRDSGDAIIKLLEMMGNNEGIGAALAKGSRKAAEILGKGEEYLVVANGIEQPQHDPRYYYGLGRTYLSDPTPGRHVKASISPTTTDPKFDPSESLRDTGEEDLKAVVETELMNACGACSFGYQHGNPHDAIMRNVIAVTGFEYNEKELSKLALRIFTMRQAFNLREGIRRKDFAISKRAMGPSFHAALDNQALDFNLMVDNLYDILGWSREGVPAIERLVELGGLEEVTRDLYGENPAKGGSII